MRLSTRLLSACAFLILSATSFASDRSYEDRYKDALEKIERLQEKAQTEDKAQRAKKLYYYGQLLTEVETRWGSWNEDENSRNSMLRSRKLDLALSSVEEIFENAIPKDNRQNENLNPANVASSGSKTTGAGATAGSKNLAHGY